MLYKIMSTFWQDIRFATRMLIKHPGFTAVAVAALALGIGVNMTVFTLTNAVLFKALPFDQDDRLVFLMTPNRLRNEQFGPVSYPDFRDWIAQAKSFEGLCLSAQVRINMADDVTSPDQYQGTRLTANTFRLIGQHPVAGRDFTESDEAPGAAPVAILTYGLWERRFGKDPSVIGRTIRINEVLTTVIGVMPPGLTFPVNADLWLPLVPTPEFEKREARNLFAFGKTKKDVPVPSARKEIEGISSNLEKAYPTTNTGFGAVVRTFSQVFVGPFIKTLFLSMLGAVGFVLLIACANVANLLLSRAVGRSREISLRIAVGANRLRVIRQLLVESVMLSLIGGIFGLLIAVWGVRAFDLAVTPFGKPPWIDFSMDFRVVAYFVAISIGTGILFGLAPALRLSKLDVNSGIRDGGRGMSIGGRGRYLSGLLVVVEIALALILLTGAGLMVRSFLNIYRADLGIHSANVLTMRLQLPDVKYASNAEKISFYERLQERLKSVPGVNSIAIATFLPTGGSQRLPYEFEGAPPMDPQRRPVVGSVVISPEYFDVWQVRAVAGRVFAETDDASNTSVVIVNKAFADKSWAGQDPLGKRLRLFTGSSPEPWMTVVGVVPNIVQNDISPQQIDPVIYLPLHQKVVGAVAIIARTLVPPGNLGTTFRREVQTVDPNMPVFNLWTMKERLQRNYWLQGIIGILFAIFAALAVLLASVGLYAVIAHSVGQRTQEIGIRVALGATARGILVLVLAQGVRQIAIGLAIGLFGSFALTRILRSLLVQISPGDPGTFMMATLVLSFAAILGCLVPARRAMRVDPVIALHHE